LGSRQVVIDFLEFGSEMPKTPNSVSHGFIFGMEEKVPEIETGKLCSENITFAAPRQRIEARGIDDLKCRYGLENHKVLKVKISSTNIRKLVPPIENLNLNLQSSCMT